MGDSSIRLGVDIGGTFTDVVLETSTESYSTKVLTTYSAPEDAIIEGMHRVCRDAGISTDLIGQIIHGTTFIKERLDASGGVLTPIVKAEVEALADELKAAGYESIAVCLCLRKYRRKCESTSASTPPLQMLILSL